MPHQSVIISPYLHVYESSCRMTEGDWYVSYVIPSLSIRRHQNNKRTGSSRSLSVPPLFYFYLLHHAAGHSQCRCDGRQHTNGCLDCEFPKCLVLHNKLRFKLEIRNERSSFARLLP